MLLLWQNLPIEECQLDALWSFVHTKAATLAAAKEISDKESTTYRLAVGWAKQSVPILHGYFVFWKSPKLICQSYGDGWVWIAFAPIWRMVVAFGVGKRTQAKADLLVQRVFQVSVPSIPFLTSEQLAAYPTAVLHIYGQWVQPERKGNPGAYPTPHQVAPTNLLYAQVVKQPEAGHVVDVSYRVILGQPDQIETYLKCSSVS